MVEGFEARLAGCLKGVQTHGGRAEPHAHSRRYAGSGVDQEVTSNEKAIQVGARHA